MDSTTHSAGSIRNLNKMYILSRLYLADLLIDSAIRLVTHSIRTFSFPIDFMGVSWHSHIEICGTSGCRFRRILTNSNDA
jgi:hypothetical protein